MKIEILNRWTNKVIFTHEAEENSIAITVRKAVAEDAKLDGANLYGANLYGANLDGAKLDGANLDYAKLDGANLTRANLSLANLYGAKLDGANLTRANLYGANLYGANLYGANLTPIRDDIWAVLSSAPLEVAALIEALKTGRVDGSTYSGECSCLVGTIAAARKVNHSQLPGLTPNSERAAERFFIGIRKGDTPETSQFSKLAMEWAQDWLDTQRAAFDPTFVRVAVTVVAE